MSVRSFYFVLACAACAHYDNQNTEDIILNKDIKPASLYAANSTINTDGEENTLATKKEAVGTNGDIIYDLSGRFYLYLLLSLKYNLLQNASGEINYIYILIKCI